MVAGETTEERRDGAVAVAVAASGRIKEELKNTSDVLEKKTTLCRMMGHTHALSVHVERFSLAKSGT
jgi:hypothetical protein